MSRLFLVTLLLKPVYGIDLPQEDTRMVDLNVIALDGQSAPVTDLTRDDFRLTGAGKPETIAFFRHRDSAAKRPSRSRQASIPTAAPRTCARHPDPIRHAQSEIRHARPHYQQFDSRSSVRPVCGLLVPLHPDGQRQPVSCSWPSGGAGHSLLQSRTSK